MSNPRRANLRVGLPEPLASGENAIRITIHHDKGGINYSNYQTEPEGYWVTASPVEVGDGFEKTRITFGKGLGRRFFVAPSSRFNFKKLEALAGFVATRKDQIVAHLVAERYEDIRTMLDEGRREVFGEAA